MFSVCEFYLFISSFSIIQSVLEEPLCMFIMVANYFLILVWIIFQFSVHLLVNFPFNYRYL